MEKSSGNADAGTEDRDEKAVRKGPTKPSHSSLQTKQPEDPATFAAHLPLGQTVPAGLPHQHTAKPPRFEAQFKCQGDWSFQLCALEAVVWAPTAVRTSVYKASSELPRLGASSGQRRCRVCACTTVPTPVQHLTLSPAEVFSPGGREEGRGERREGRGGRREVTLERHLLPFPGWYAKQKK